MKNVHRWLVPLLAATAMPALAQTAAVSTAMPAVAAAPVRFQIFLPLRNTQALQTLIEAQQTEGSPSYHQWLTPAQFAAQFGPTPDAMAAAKAAVQAAGLSVTKVTTRSLQVSGTAGNVNRLLGTTLGSFKDIDGRNRLVALAKPVMTPALQQLGAQIVAFTGVPPHHAFATKANVKAVPDNRNGPDGGYNFTDLKQAYDYPSYKSRLPNGQQLTGQGVRIALLMSDLIYPNDVQLNFDHEKFTAVSGDPAPKVNTVLINGGGVQDGYGSFEASLDVQMATGGAPGATTTLVSLPDLSDDNIIDGYQYIVDSNQYDIVSSSFGECEQFYLPAYNSGTDYTGILRLYEDIFAQGNAEGISFLASSGDNGALECTNLAYLMGKAGRFTKGVSTPAASKFVTAVGGGNLVTTYTAGSLRSAYVSENAYGDPEIPYDPYGTGGTASGGIWGAGGGKSVIFTQPSFQFGTKTGDSVTRTVPDVGMQVGGCPGGISQQPCGPDRSYVIIYYDGGRYGLIGTSVSSPEFAGALALYVQSVGRIGNANTFLYQRGRAQTKAGGMNAVAARQYYHRNIPGNDGVYTDTVPSSDYNYLNGNGTPDVRRLFGFAGLPAAGVPQTVTNP